MVSRGKHSGFDLATALAADARFLEDNLRKNLLAVGPVDGGSNDPEDVLAPYMVGDWRLGASDSSEVSADFTVNADLSIVNVFEFRIRTGRSQYALDHFFVPAIREVPSTGSHGLSVASDGNVLLFRYESAAFANGEFEGAISDEVRRLCRDPRERIAAAEEAMRLVDDVRQARDEVILASVAEHRGRIERARSAMEIALSFGGRSE